MLNVLGKGEVKRWALRGVNLFRTRTRSHVLILLICFASPLLIYIWIISTHRLSNLREIFAALHVWTLPVVEGYPRCKHLNSTHYLCLPNTFLIGASKCGTTTVIEFLSRQPGVALINRRITVQDHHREIHRFDRHTYPYALHFLELADEWASSPIVPDPNTIVIHYTPHYLYSPTVPFTMRSFYPTDLAHKPKFLVMLREPSERAISAYWFASSHLFSNKASSNVLQNQLNMNIGKTDSGSMNEFVREAMEQMGARHTYEKCMQEYQKGKQQQQQQESQLQQELPLLPSIMSSATMYEALCSCFGDDLRSSKLGARHLDKSIYVDQLQRWYLNFLPTVSAPSTTASTTPSSANTNIDRNRANDGIDNEQPIESLYFISTLEDLKQRPKEMLQQMLTFLYTNNESSDSIKLQSTSTSILPSEVYLTQPNALSKLSENQLSEEMRNVLMEFYRPYTKQLEVLLKKYPVTMTKGVIMES